MSDDATAEFVLSHDEQVAALVNWIDTETTRIYGQRTPFVLITAPTIPDPDVGAKTVFSVLGNVDVSTMIPFLMQVVSDYHEATDAGNVVEKRLDKGTLQ
jgi:hypothetical protein